jgi:hypothetical protein
MVVLSPVFAMSGTGDACLTTLPANQAFVPPAPYDAKSAAGFWYGTDDLWTQLEPDGVWHLANNSDKNHGYVTS